MRIGAVGMLVQAETVDDVRIMAELANGVNELLDVVALLSRSVIHFKTVENTPFPITPDTRNRNDLS